ncbi:MAG TPA: YIP1 family protein [Acidimicrobiia bacterium]|nr:YIP1 family protein [Acidimicrobiia bacterium]
MFSRAGRAALLDRKPFTEAFFDGDSAADAAILVSIVAGVTYVGSLVLNGVIGLFDFPTLLQVVIAGVVSWLVLGFATWFAATRLFQSTAKPQTMIALQGLAVLPLVLELFGQIGGVVGLIWYLVILVVGTREAAGIDTRNAAVSVLIGLAVAVIFRALLGVPFAIFGALF